MEDSKFDLWLEARPRLDRIYTKVWSRTVGRWYSFKRFVVNWYPDWKDRRLYKPGEFFLDHGWTPCVIVKDSRDKDVVHGVSLLNGSFQVSDRYHCGPLPCTQKDAVKIAAMLKKMGRV